ncbi:hypothetical protein ACOSP7_003205 [Xanthoceras sorbifolium]
MKGLHQFLGLLVFVVMTISLHSANAMAVVVMNHGSFRGPRKHLINPTAHQQFPFQLPKLPVYL